VLAFIPLTNASEENVLLATAAGLQMGSEHPLAKALLDAAKVSGVSPIPPSESQAIAGIGISGKPSSGPWAGQNLALQSVASLANTGSSTEISSKVQPLLEAGQTVSVLMNQELPPSPLAIIAFGDELKANAKAAIASLHQLHIRTVMLSGDNTAAANRVGRSIGMDQVFGQIMPSNKAEIIRTLQASGKEHVRQYVAMVGDGVNDAPALATADVGMAMSTGTDVAMQAAGITLMRGDPSLVADAIDISKRTWKKIQQNLFWAFAFNSTGIPLAALGYLSPMLAGSAMALSSFCVLSNALLLKRWRPSHR
jgi:Cu+-exporting ATPase